MACTLDDIRCLAADLLDYWHFVGDLPLVWRQERAERARWEVFQGRLLDEAHTRQERTFESWNVHEQTESGPSAEPLLSLKLDAAEGRLHVVRGVESYVWEGYDAGGGVYQSRERRKWARELIATFELSRFAGVQELREEVAVALGRAVTGSRLPLTPVEAPLPAFSFGRLWYPSDRAGDPPSIAYWLGSLEDYLPQAMAGGESGRVVEFWLRSRSPEELIVCWRAAGLPPAYLLRALRRMFRDVSLSPCTDFVDRVLKLLGAMEQGGLLQPEDVVDFEGPFLLRLVCRHLTAYDLVTFHYRGANYPDALLLEAVLGDYLTRLEQSPGLFLGEEGRPRRRALRQAYLLRRRYEEHPVPDVPTSPGEHMRVFPEGHPRVPEEQILQPARRRRRLFAGDPLLRRLGPAARRALVESLADLRYADECEELGAAVFLDRPFGGAKGPVEPEGTPLLASLAYSRSIAEQRLRELASDLDVREAETSAIDLPGLPLDSIGGPVRQGTVSLADAGRAAADFVFRRTLPGSVRALGELFDFGQLAARLAGRVLVARSPRGPGLVVYDEEYRPRLEIEPRLEAGYASRRGLEYPAAGLRVTHIDGEALAEPVTLRPRV